MYNDIEGSIVVDLGTGTVRALGSKFCSKYLAASFAASTWQQSMQQVLPVLQAPLHNAMCAPWIM
jgi:hypothetical protein